MNKELREMQDTILAKQGECEAMLAEKKVDEAKALVEEIKELKAEMAVKTELEDIEKMNIETTAVEVKSALSVEDAEIKAFADFIRTSKANEQNFTVGNNGAVIPTTIAKLIIRKVEQLCPIYEKCLKFNAKGTLKIPVYGPKTVSNTDHDITVGYASDFSALTPDAGAFTSVDLTGYLCGVLTLVGKSLIYNGDIDIVSFVVDEMAKKIAAFIEKELLNGTNNKITGALSTTNSLTAASASAITTDELIELQMKVPTQYQADACWIMAPATLLALRKLKYTGTGEYILNRDFTAPFGYTIMGKPVYPSDNMPAIAASAKTVLYGDLTGLATNMPEQIEISILQEAYATQHAIGVCGYFELDAKVCDNQKLAVLTMASGQ